MQKNKPSRIFIVILTMALTLVLHTSIIKAEDLKNKNITGGEGYEQIERKYYDFLTGGTFVDTGDHDVVARLNEINESAKKYWDTMNLDSEKTFIWNDLTMTFTGKDTTIASSYEMTITFLRLSIMCQAYRTKGGKLYDNKELGRDILNALIWMNDNKYKPDGQTYGNWWDWRIGSPLRFIDCIVLMKNEITDVQYKKSLDTLFAYVSKNRPRPGDANSMWYLFIRLMVGVLNKDDSYIKTVIDEIDRFWFRYTTSGNGFYADGSYVFHTAYPYTGSYGASAIESFAKLAYLVNGTAFDISQASKNQAIRWINEAYVPIIYNGLAMDMTRGRAVSSEKDGDHLTGHVIIRSIYLFSLTVPENDALPIQEIIKYWITADTHRSIYYGEDYATSNNNYIFFINKLKQFMKDSTVSTADKPVFHKQFAAMAQIVHSRPDFTFAISMHSDTIQNYESVNGENLMGWNMAMGMTYLYNEDMGQFSDNYWPTVNPYRLPGTTVNRNTKIQKGKTNGDSWVGGTSMDDMYGIAGMYLIPSGQTLNAKKSWFMFDDEIVALGSGINASDNKIVETVIENRKLMSDNSNTFIVNGNVVSASAVTSKLANSTWIHLSGNGEKSDIGYYFPSPSDVRFVRGKRSGAWSEINSNKLKSFKWNEKLQANYLTMYFDHGNNPKDASYNYVILPNKSSEQTKKYSQYPDITVLENSTEAHGVYKKSLLITGVNFWNDAIKTVDLITSYQKSSVMVRETNAEIFVSISDPTKQKGSMIIQIDLSAAECLTKDDNITIIQLSPTIMISIDVKGKNGMPSYVAFKK